MSKNKLAVIGLILGLGIIGYSIMTSGTFKKRMADFTGYSEFCIDGVKYIQFASGASVKYRADGKVDLCN